MMLNSLNSFFTKIDNRLCKNMLIIVEAMIMTCGCNTSLIASYIAKLKDSSFKTADMFVYRFLANDKFKVSELLFRCYINMIFSFLHEIKQIKFGDKIYIQVDFTSDRDDFLILCASIIFSNRAIPIYFSMRNYPKEKDQYNHKKMEQAFIKALRHYLSDNYQYVIVADRGFGNERFINLCKDNDFEYSPLLIFT